MRPAARRYHDSNKAVTFAGFTPNLAAVSIVADMDAPVTSLIGKSIGGAVRYSAHGSTTAGPIWKDADARCPQG